MMKPESISARDWTVKGIRKLISAWCVGWEVYKNRAGDRMECAVNEIISACNVEYLTIEELREAIMAGLTAGYTLADQDRVDKERGAAQDLKEGGDEEGGEEE